MSHLEILSQLVHHPSVLAADLLAPGAAVGGIVAHMDAGGREGGALGAGAHGPLRGALALGAVIRVQKIPLSHVVSTAVGLADILLLYCEREAPSGLCAEHKSPECRTQTALLQ